MLGNKDVFFSSSQKTKIPFPFCWSLSMENQHEVGRLSGFSSTRIRDLRRNNLSYSIHCIHPKTVKWPWEMRTHIVSIDKRDIYTVSRPTVATQATVVPSVHWQWRQMRYLHRQSTDSGEHATLTPAVHRQWRHTATFPPSLSVNVMLSMEGFFFCLLGGINR